MLADTYGMKQPSNASTGPEFVTLDQASSLSSVPVTTLRQWIREGRIQAFKPGRRPMVRPGDLRALIERSAIGGVR